MATGYEPERTNWVGNVFLDDQLWHQAMMQLSVLDDLRGIPMPDTEQRLFYMIQSGVVDHSDEDRAWAASSRSMRHSASLAGDLWALIRQERTRVRSFSALPFG